MPRAEHCEGGRGKGGERVPSALSALVMMSCLLEGLSREPTWRVCLLVRRSLLSLGPGAEGRSHYVTT
eukprot:scaffold5373_cov103-Isochrysis_galbana.AAC.1